jgi:hypothetical protein
MARSEYVHSICLECWKEINPGIEPHHTKNAIELGDEKCCSCGKDHSSRIYIRENPAVLLCKGRHE